MFNVRTAVNNIEVLGKYSFIARRRRKVIIRTSSPIAGKDKAPSIEIKKTLRPRVVYTLIYIVEEP